MSPFICRVKTASGATAAQIMEKQERQNVMLRHIGSARTEFKLAALIQQAHQELHPGQLSFDFDEEVWK